MMPMVDNVTGMVYWVPIEYQPPVQPPFAPVVMPYRLLRPVAPETAPSQEVNTTVFVRGVSREATTQSVESHFSCHGDIVSCHVIRHKDASTNKGIAFVKFRDREAAQRAINCNSPGVMDRREIFAEWAHPKPATSVTRSLPDQPIVPEHIPISRRVATPHLYLTPPATHLVNPTPSYYSPVMPAITFSVPWIVSAPGASSSTMAPYGPGYGGPVMGFPHPGGFSGGVYNYPEISLARSPNYFPGLGSNYNPGSGSAVSVSRTFDAENSDPRQSFDAESSANSENRKEKNISFQE